MSPHSLIIAPSILSADFSRLQEEVDSISSYADWIQIDVMDGHFVPNLSFGAPVVKWIQSDLPLDIHLMVSNPSERIAEFVAIGASHITFHAEAVTDTDKRKDLIATIKKSNATVGIAINPETPLDNVSDVIGEVDLLLVMSVHPGFGGQSFISEVLEKVKDARAKHPDLMIQMDGGIDDTTAKTCIEAGANNLVAGSFIFTAKDRKLAIESLHSSL